MQQTPTETHAENAVSHEAEIVANVFKGTISGI
jgi:hypothetical protein